MLQRWKLILSNWINCYFNNSEDEEQNLNIEALITIISHLRQNLNLDESKSSLLEAHTVEEFIREKYPEFKFENGTLQASNEEEVCLAASLLLFFVCVNSKNLDIKNAMCSKLRADDQDIIIKFSKCLLECPVITVGEVQAAITEACGQDIAAMELPRRYTVAETPPAMRSMHSNIRRLQAELEAERFDRNYLQDELARTNSRLEKLLKEKEQHKLEILSLKGKISLCCGDEGTTRSSEGVSEESSKLARQLQQQESKLEETLTQLHDVQYERDTLKQKMDHLKTDRDKWLALVQQENARVSQLSDELETERRHNQSLKDLVADLRQHNRLNGLDTSSLECDDPDASIHSLQHNNSSICSEACANVVEVQLGEERAKIVVLQQQIQTLHTQINQLNEIRETEKASLQNAVAQRDNDICDLKHRINEEIEKKNNMKAHCDNEITKLNNEINELEQKLKESHEYSRAAIEQKMGEIQTLQEEKLSLIQSLNNETTKLENVIQELQHDLDSEKQSRSKMKDTYENHVMKLNEKVLNRNNELVELQNSIFTKAEEIETLQIDIRNEKEAFAKLMTQYESLDSQKNTLQNDLRKEKDTLLKVTHEKDTLLKQKASLEIEIEKEKKAFGELINKYQIVNEQKDAVEKELAREQEIIKELNKKYEDIEKDHKLMESDLKKVKEAGKKLQNKYHTLHEHHKELKAEHCKDKEIFAELKIKHQDLEKIHEQKQMELVQKTKDLEDLKHKYDETVKQINALKNNLEKEKDVVKEYKAKHHNLEKENTALQTNIRELKESHETLNKEYKDMISQRINVQDELKKEKESFKELLQNYQNLVEHKNMIENDLKLKCDEEEHLKSDLEAKVLSMKDKLTESEELAEKLKTSYECQIENLNVMVTKLTNYMKEKTSELEILRADKELLQQSIVDHCRVIDHLQGELTAEKQNIEKITSDFESERQVLKNMVTVTESVMEDTKLALNNEISDLTKVKLALVAEKADLEASVTDLRRKYEALETANTSLLSLLQIEKKGKADVEKESEMVREYLDQVIRDLEQERKTNASVIQTLESQKQTLIEENVALKKDLEDLQTVSAQLKSKANAFEDEIKSLKDEKCQLDEICQHTAKMLAEAQCEINKQREKLENLIDENSNLKETKEIICDEKEKYKSEINNLKTEAQSQEEKIKALLEEKSQTKVDIQNLKDRLQDILKEKSELESHLEEKSQNITKVQQEIKQLQSKILILTDDNNLLKFRENESSSKIRQLENSMKVLETGFRSQLEFESNDKTIFMDKFRKLEDELEKVSEEKMLLENEIQEKTVILKAVQLKNEELENKVAILTDENNNLMLEKKESLTKLGEYNAKEFDLRNDLELAQYANNNLTIAIRAVETELNTKDEELAKLTEEKEDLEVALKDKEDALNLVQAELKDMQVKLAEYTCTVDSLKQDKEEACVKVEELSVKLEAIEQIKTVNTDLKTTIHDLENNLLSKENDLQTALQQKLELGNNLQTHIMKLAEATEKKTEVETSLQKTVQNLNVVKTELKELNNQIAVLLNERDKSEMEKQESSAKIEKFNAKIKDLEAVHNDKQELSTKVALLEKELHSTSVKLETVIQEKTKLEGDIQNLTDQLQKVTEEKKKTEKGLEEKTAQEISHTAMITKLTNYLKEKTTELEALRKDKEILQQTVGDSCKVIKTLEETVRSEKQNIDKLTSDFESERQVLKNMVSATESVMEDTKLCLNNEISQHLIEKECLQVEKKDLQASLKDLQNKHQDLELASASLLTLFKLERAGKQDVEKESENVREYLDEVISYLSRERNTNISVISALEFQEKAMAGDYEKMKSDYEMIQKTNKEMKTAMKDIEKELHTKEDELHKVLQDKAQVENQLHEVLESKSQLEQVINEKTQNLNVFQIEIRELKNKMEELFNVKNTLELEKRESQAKLEEFRTIVDSNETKDKEELSKLKSENKQLLTTIEENKTVITNLEQLIKHELEENHKLRDDFEQEKMVLSNKCCILQDYQTKAEKVLEDRQKEIDSLQKEVQTLQNRSEITEQDCKAKDGLISKMSKEKDAVISTISKELVEEKALREKLEKELQSQKTVVNELRNNIEIRALKKENEQLIRAIGQQETLAALSQDKAADRYPCLPEPHQVDSTTSDYTHSSVESLKTITDLEKIIHDKNRTITTLQTDITYLKTLMAESETKLMDVTKELELSKDNVQQLSNQLKKIVYQKNEEIAELKKQVNKMTATENRASQIIKVSAKYQAMILKRIAEIKSNTVLKELQNLGNSENELRRSLNAGSVTMEDLENFLDTTDRHLKRCAEKQIALQKERDRLTEINRINESEIINLKKFLTELSVSFQTFSSMKDLYAQKLSLVVSVQRTVRREILSLDGRISDATMCKLERGYGATMQDLAECTMNLERWVEKCISRTVSAEKIKQAFTSDTERSSLSTPSFQNTGLEIQLEELQKSFQKLLEDIARAVKNEGAVESQASTVMEVRAEYEDKLNRMKAKMKDLFNEQMTILKNKQREEIELLERELQKTRTRMEDSKRAYEAHIKELTKELWNVGEKYLVKRDEADWLQRKQKSGSLMSLQHVHSSGLMSHHELPSRPSDAHSLRSLPVADSHPKPKREARGLHMSDEEGEVFDNRCLKELAMTPRREPTGQRLSELKWRNSFCPPHLKSSYPAETQFAATLDEDDLKAGTAAAGARAQRKEVGITAYKKPGPPTPSKQAGRLSATDSELRESLRVESEPLGHAERKTSTPARFRGLFQRNKHDNSDGTPRARRLSNIFRKKQ